MSGSHGTSTFTTLRVDRTAAVCTLTLSRPDLLNRFDTDLHHEFTETVREVADDASVRAVILAAEGKVFSAGGDFELMRAAHADAAVRADLIRDGRRLLEAVGALPQPLVVALTGLAMGLGATVALSGDVVVACPDAALADTHVNVGLVAGDGGCLVWTGAVGSLRARRHLLTGDSLPAELAHQLGAVTDLVERREDVLPEATRIAERIAGLPPLAVQGTKRTLAHAARARANEVVELGFALEAQTLASDDLLEAIAAFHERRPGLYEGR